MINQSILKILLIIDCNSVISIMLIIPNDIHLGEGGSMVGAHFPFEGTYSLQIGTTQYPYALPLHVL